MKDEGAGAAEVPFRSGMVTLLGRPNVGKSSLVNAMVGHKVSIVTPKPQTTRHRLQGVLHLPQAQVVFVDTPGLHRNSRLALNRYMNRVAADSMAGVDLVVFVIEAGQWTEEDQAVLQRLRSQDVPVGLVINKVDRIKDKAKLLPEIQRLSALHDFAFVVPLSAMRRDNTDALAHEIVRHLPVGPQLYPPEQLVGHGEAFQIAEIIREKLMLRLRQELPYALTVAVEKLEREGRLRRIDAVVWVERDGQKKIVIGEDGAQMKAVATAARRDLERELGGKVFLQVWVRVREGWTDDQRALESFGYVTE